MTEAVTAYLAEHPAAMDTLEGIAEWWLMRARVRADLVRLQRVLGRMVDAGILEAVGSPDSPTYHLRRR